MREKHGNSEASDMGRTATATHKQTHKVVTSIEIDQLQTKRKQDQLASAQIAMRNQTQASKQANKPT